MTRYGRLCHGIHSFTRLRVPLHRYNGAFTTATSTSRPRTRVQDFVVLGGGIIGINIASQLRQRFPGASVTLLEKEHTVGQHASGRNSGVLHAGFYYSSDSLKAKLTRRGNVFLHEYCQEKQLPINTCGKLVVAKNDKELEGLETLYQRGITNGVPLEKISEKEAQELEPMVRTHQQAIWSPTTASADPAQVTTSMAQDAETAGVDILTGKQYLQSRGFQQSSSSTVALDVLDNTTKELETLETKHLVNCAGLYADKIAHPFGFGLDYQIVPFKGLYLYCKDVNLQRLVYPVPQISQPFLGVHFTVTVDGKVKIGPTAIPAFWREQYGPGTDVPLLDRFSWSEITEILVTEASLFYESNFNFRSLALEEMKKYSKRFMAQGASELVRGITLNNFTDYGKAGIRAQLVNMKQRKLEMDFVIEGDSKSTHVLNAVSPAWTCARPFAEIVADQIQSRLSRSS
eukprot:gb/GECG01012493.1/.p1 GENE.gb/GECG01012493.1/~~gb/GECG01012493.1/.p1  ORF type:complete len:459 (+),score=48.67 gb/GECG01012493.1/:1-1377(+)